ncbi:MAG: hypothetical protein FJ304_17715 [Planctomycetes bacterium]|nr:hypothetical protein [Planctomycetota bacterium]
MTAPRFSVVLHLPDARGIDAQSVRSWVAQDLARERFEVVAVTDGRDRATERRVPPLLGSPDSLLRFPRATRAELFDRGARAASSSSSPNRTASRSRRS